MVSPFPGMDPFIEGDSWQDFHLDFIAQIRQFLIPVLRPRYLVRAQERVYLEHALGNGHPRSISPDVSVVAPRLSRPSASEGRAGIALAEGPTTITLPIPVREREHYLTILWRDTMEVVTVIEVLSPTNKRPSSDGRREYIAKREIVLMSNAHLVELDLLRGGQRPPTVEPLPRGDYYAIVSRAGSRPGAGVYAWPVLDPMPTIPIPLGPDDADAALDLQGVFASVYERSDYDYSLDYSRPLEPPLRPADAAAIADMLPINRPKTSF